MGDRGVERFGRYELVERLGQGGMAEVWKARIDGAAGFRRTLVVKRILPHLARDKELVAMFMREAQLCSMLSHGNIVQVYELGELDGEFYLAMEYVHGRDLHAFMQANPRSPPPPGLAALIGRDVCRALAYAYGVPGQDGEPLRVIHRDVTPANVMLTLDGTVKLVDFGVAKALSMVSSTLTNIGAVRGKLGYAAPEQLLSGDVDHRTDLFAVGILIHELLTGRRLFTGDDDRELIERVLEGQIHPPSRINPAVPAALDPIVMRALERDPARRFQTGEEMADAFEPIVYDLGWGPRHVAAIVLERFPSLEQRQKPRVEEEDEDTVTERNPPLELRPTATFVTVADHMGQWTTTESTTPGKKSPASKTVDTQMPTIERKRAVAKKPVPLWIAFAIAALGIAIALFVLR